MALREAPCERQVFTDESAAQRTANALKTVGVDSSVERCELCGFVHLKEINKKALTRDTVVR